MDGAKELLGSLTTLVGGGGDREGGGGKDGMNRNAEPSDELRLPQLPKALERSIKNQLEQLKERDNLILHLEKQLAEATKQVAEQQQNCESTHSTLGRENNVGSASGETHRPRRPSRPPRRTRAFGGGHRRAKKKCQKKTTFAGFIVQGQRNNKLSAMPKYPRPSARHQAVIPKTPAFFSNGSTSNKRNAKLKRIRLKSSKTRSAKKAAKYGRVSKKRGGGNYAFRTWSRKHREQMWSLPKNATVLRNLVDQFQVAAHKRMRPKMSAFDGAPMDRSHLRQVVHVELGISLKRTELEAIFEAFDRDKSGTVDFQEVVHVLFSKLWTDKATLPPRIRV